MSQLDQIITDGLADWREKQAKEAAEREVREANRHAEEGKRLQDILKLLLGIDVVPNLSSIPVSAEIEGYTISLRLGRDNYTSMYITKDGLRYGEDKSFGGYVYLKNDKSGLYLPDRNDFLLSFKSAKEIVDAEIAHLANPKIAPSPTIAVHALDAEEYQAISIMRELIDAVETGWTLNEQQLYLMATIRYTDAIRRWTQRDEV